ncbi:HEAT repeat domain-containing protein [Planctellipticum variicoloris]|uniref:HEAT repeat domain-containing protein n=1 Tax=Planctellipticum variicoloris TaxID=3064265 RepID=UPI00301366C6|nr:HEAT repeat domain-containing protein [Planctomycetaceae bacterium SH412]
MFSFCRFLLSLALLAPLPAGAADVIRVEFQMLSDPEIPPIPPNSKFDVRCISLWSQALRRPEVDYQRMAAETVARARELNMPGVDALKPELRTILAAPATAPSVRYAAARALIVLDDRESSTVLLEQSRVGGLLLRQLVEPALAEWSDEAIQPIWRDRLSNSQSPRQELLLAIRGLGRVGDPAALPKLLEMVHADDRPPEVRLAAAEAAGRIAAEGLEAEVDRLLAAPDRLRRLSANELLSRHSSPRAVELLSLLGRESEPTVAWKALARLREIDPALVLPLAEVAMRHADANVRREGIETYLALPTPERMAFVGRLLDDPHPALRGRIRDEFVVLARRPELDGPIRDIARSVLAGESWRGQEQALLVLGTLDDDPSAVRFLDLLKSPRPEVLVTAAWGLRKVAVAETLPAIQQFVTEWTAKRRTMGFTLAQDHQIAHLCEALGVMQHQPADALLREYLPLNLVMGELSRPAAIWALGKLYDGRFDQKLAEALIGRVLDPATMPPEFSEVKQMSAVSLARMKATSTVERLQGYLGPVVTPHREPLVLRWSLMTLTGKEIPLPEPITVTVGSWFLEPTTNAPAEE